MDGVLFSLFFSSFLFFSLLFFFLLLLLPLSTLNSKVVPFLLHEKNKRCLPPLVPLMVSAWC